MDRHPGSVAIGGLWEDGTPGIVNNRQAGPIVTWG
jgi:hypothetical protein